MSKYLFAFIYLFPSLLLAQYNPIERISVDKDGFESTAGGMSGFIQSSADGRFVVFVSSDDDLVLGDDNGVEDVFLYDRTNDTLELISTNKNGSDANGRSYAPSLSSDGRYVVFTSEASDLIVGDDNGVTDIYIRDTQSDTTERVSVDTDELESNGDSHRSVVSSDGQFVAFSSEATNLVAGDTNGFADIFVRDRTAGSTVRVSLTDDEEEATGGDSLWPSISADGSLVVFQSDATNLFLSDGNSATDIFLRDTDADTTTLLSKNDDDSEGDADSLAPVISADGTVVVFSSQATNLAGSNPDGLSHIFAAVVATEAVEIVSVDSDETEGDGGSTLPTLTADGNLVFFQSEATNLDTSNDENGVGDIFVRDRDSGTTARISLRPEGGETTSATMNVSVNSDGHFVTFQSDEGEYVDSDDNGVADVFVFNTQCLLTDEGFTELDSDNDGTDDCSDECGGDADKTEPGDCGCGNADTDTDSDGTADCLDGCPSDGDKAAPGVCGCGASDDDSNSNGVADCLDPTSSTVPQEPLVTYRKRRDRLVFRVPNASPGARGYRWIVKRDGVVVMRRKTTGIRLRLRNPQGGRYKARYRILLSPTGKTQLSTKAAVRVR